MEKPNSAGKLATTPRREMEGDINPTAYSGSVDARSPKRAMEGDIVPTGSMAWFKKGKTGMEGDINPTAYSGSVDARSPKSVMEGDMDLTELVNEAKAAMKDRSQLVLIPFLYEGVFAVKGRYGGLCTRNIVPGEVVSDGRIISFRNKGGAVVEYVTWNPLRSSLAAAIGLQVDNIWIKPGARVLYLGAGSGETVCHVSNIVGLNGVVYAVESSSLGCVKELVNMVARRANVIPIIEDARHPENYATIVGEKVDVIYCDIAKADQVTILVNNATHYLKEGGNFLMLMKADCNGTLSYLVDKQERELDARQLSAEEITVLDPFMPNHALAVGDYKGIYAS